MRVSVAAAAVSDPRDEALLRQLDHALAEPVAGTPADLDALLRMFERHPDADGLGVFWTALHWLEAQPATLLAPTLRESLQRRPAEFSMLLAWRTLRAGGDASSSAALLRVLRHISNDGHLPADIVADARAMLAAYAPQPQP